MSKAMKILCLVAAGMVAFGLVLSGGAYMFGAGTNLSWNPSERDYDENGEYNPVGMTVVSDTFDSFNAIDLDVDYQEVTLQTGDSFQIESHYDNKYSTVFFEVKDGKLTVTENSRRQHRGFPWILTEPKRREGKLTITYPEGTKFTSIEIDSDMADITVNDGAADQMKVDADLGVVELSRVQVGTLEINADMGGILLEDSSADTVKLSCSLGDVETHRFVCRQSFTAEASAGDIELSGDFQGTTKISCDLGSVSVKLAGKRQDYKFDLDTDLGGIEVDGRDVGGRETGDGGPHYLEVNNSAGDIEIHFSDID